MANKVVTLPNGQRVVLVPRQQLKLKQPVNKFMVPPFPKAAIPTPPLTFSGSKGRTIKYPILGNDQEGDCYLADALHCIQTFTGNVGQPAQFDAQQALQRYEQLSGGDNGLGDDQIFPAWKSGLLEVNGPHKILDYMTVNVNDDAAIRLAMWLFCGTSWTCSLLSGWLNATSPGTYWDAGMGSPDPNAGHAMHLSGYVNGTSRDYYEDETWAIDPCIRLTPAGLKAADPEVTVQFSLEMFNAQGIAPHNGMSYNDLAALWVQLGGHQLPPSPFGPPPVGGPPYKLFEGTMATPIPVGLSAGYPDLTTAETSAHSIADQDNVPVMIHDNTDKMVETVQPGGAPPLGNFLTLVSALQPGVYAIGGSGGTPQQKLDELKAAILAAHTGVIPPWLAALIALIESLLAGLNPPTP